MARPDIRYEVRRCRLIEKPVWAVLIRQPDGRLCTVNCLDKRDSCLDEARCVFTSGRGEWPFEDAPCAQDSGASPTLRADPPDQDASHG